VTDALDVELQKEPQMVRHSPPRGPSFVPLIVGIVILAALAAVFFLRRNGAAPAPAGTTATEGTVASATPPLGVQVEPIELPPLDASDDLVRQLVRMLSTHPRIAAWLATDGLIRNFTVVVENIAAGRTPAQHLRVLRPSEPFSIIDARGSGVVVDPRSYNRYNGVAEAVASVDADDAARLYSTLKPRIEEAYRELGESGPFDRVLETAIVQLLAAPAVRGEIALVPRGAVYHFNDSRIERLTQAQKQLVRMGERNAAMIQRALRDVALALGIPPGRLPPR
jgi:tRNA isopentenyl-2-thiomethyl-A-37 hydroxylase MiaE